MNALSLNVKLPFDSGVRWFKHFLCALLFLSGLAGQSQIIINEYQCSNIGTHMDAAGDYHDWIELYNTSATAVDLTGYYLSDKVSNPTKWQFPSGTVPANGYLVVYCSGQGGVVNGQMHAGFKLTQTKPEHILLSDASATLIFDQTISPNKLDESYGKANFTNVWWVFTTPTPGSANGSTTYSYAQTPTFTQPPGNYSGSVSVGIGSVQSGVEIRYTTDGSLPGAGSTLFSAPISITNTTVVRAIAISSDPNVLPSYVETNTYFVNESHGIKVVSIAGGDGANGETLSDLVDGDSSLDPVGTFELFDSDFGLLAEVTGDFNKHGNDSWAYDQRGLDFISRDQYGYNYAVRDQIFPSKTRDEFQRVMLKAAASDNYPFEPGGAHIRDAFVQTLSQVGGLRVDERSYEPCVVYVNGQYWGVYEIREKVDDNDFTDYYYDQKDLDFIKTWGWTWADYGTMDHWNSTFNYITTNNMATPANFAVADEQFNWKSLIDYTCLNSYVVCKDMLNYNTAWWHGHNPDGDKKKFRYVLWDMDAVFGHYVNFTNIPDESMGADPCVIENDPNIDDPEGHMELLNALMANPMVEQYYESRYIDLGNTVFSCENMISHLDSLVALIAPEMPAQIARWGGTMTEWEGNVQALRDSINLRCVSLEDGLIDCYDLTGPYNLAINVDPPLAGDAQINSITPANYSFSGEYYGQIDITLSATPATGYLFSHWEVINQQAALTPNANSADAVIQIAQDDSIIAHFIFLDSAYVAFDVNGAGQGDIEINGTTPASYVHSEYYPLNTQLNLTAIPQPGYRFDHWETLGNTFTPDLLTESVTVSVMVADSIVAYFVEDVADLVFDVSPALGGDLSIDGNTPASYPYAETFNGDQVLNLVATPAVNYTFVRWESMNGTVFTPNANTATAQITVDLPDTITAIFLPDTTQLHFNVNPIAGGDLSINGLVPGSYVHSEYFNDGITLSLDATANPGYRFEHWTSLGTSFSPSSTDPITDIIVENIDTITAHFTEIDSFTIVYDVVPAGAGIIEVQGVEPASYVYRERYMEGTNVLLWENPSEDYEFDHWEAQHTISPGNEEQTVNFDVSQVDTVIAVFTRLPDKGVFVPDAFSPNDIGSNNVLYVYGNQITSISFYVYDRWGKEVFQSTDINTGWDGQVNGTRANAGVYFYKLMVTYFNGSTEKKSGNVTLVR